MSQRRGCAFASRRRSRIKTMHASLYPNRCKLSSLLAQRVAPVSSCHSMKPRLNPPRSGQLVGVVGHLDDMRSLTCLSKFDCFQTRAQMLKFSSCSIKLMGSYYSLH